MAKLPSSADFSEGLPQARGLNTVQAPHMQADTGFGRALQMGGDILDREAKTLSAMADREREKIDALKAEEALGKIKEARLNLTMGEEGAYSVKGGGVLDEAYATKYQSQLQTATDGVLATLTPAQQQKLQPHAQKELLGLRSDILRHSMAESESYRQTVREGSAANAQNLGIAQWADPVAFQAQLSDLRDIAASDAKRLGLVGESEEEQATRSTIFQKRASPMYVGAISAALEAQTPEGLARAEELFKQGGTSIAPEARLQLSTHIDKMKDVFAVRASTETVFSKVVADNTPTARLNVAAATAALNMNESGSLRGNHYDKSGAVIRGPVVESGMHKGDQAVGKFQIMPKVAPQDAKEAGLPWDEKLFYSATPEGEKYHEALQQAHVNRILAKVETPEQFFAAYFAGENGVAAAVKKYEKYKASGLEAMGVPPPIVKPDGSAYTLDKNRPVSFIDFMPQSDSVRAYVTKAAKTYATLPDTIQPTATELRAQLEKAHPGRPDLVASGMTAVEKRLREVEEQKKTEISTATEQAYKFMDQGQTFDAIPPSVLAKIPAKDQDAIRANFDQHLRATPRDNNQGLLTLLNSDPKYATSLSNAEWMGPIRMQLDEDTWKRLDKQRSAVLSGDNTSAQSLNSGAVNTALKNTMGLLGFKQPKSNDMAGQARVNSARAIMDQAVLEEQARLNRQLTDVEIQKLLSSKLQTQDDIKHFFGADEKKPVLTMAYSDIPSKDRAKIYDELKRQTGTAPSDEQVLLTYKQLRLKQASTQTTNGPRAL